MCMQFTLDKNPSKVSCSPPAYFSLLFHVGKLQIQVGGGGGGVVVLDVL